MTESMKDFASTCRTEPSDSMEPVEGESESDRNWVLGMPWPFPFEQFGPNDPVKPIEIPSLSDREIVTKRIEHAVEAAEADESWAVGWTIPPELREYMASPSVVSGSSSNSADTGVPTPSNVISPDNDYELHDNVGVDLIKYVRSNTIRNEQQFLLLTLAYISGLSDDPGDYISSVTTGTSSSGKTHVKNKVDELFVNCDVMDASTGSDKVLVYSDDWDVADIISMGELQQPSEEMLEFMKRAHGGDEEVVIRSTRGNPSSGFHEKVIRKDAKSYHFTFAQFDADFEFWNRLLKIPAHESESKNRAVGRMAFGHNDVSIGADRQQYGYQFEDGTERLQAHMLDIKRHAPGYCIIPDGSDDFGWDVWDVVEPIFKHGRSESNRVYKMVRNLIKASARLNYQSRESVPFEAIETNVAGENDVTYERAVIAEPQDVANVLRCLDVLRATTHEIGPRKRAVVEAIKSVGDDDGMVDGIEPIVEYLEESDASKVNMDELENILGELENDYLVSRDGDEIRAWNWDALGEPRIEKYEDRFEDCVDPITGEAFLPSWESYREQALTTGADFFSSEDEDVRIQSSGSGVDPVTPEQLGASVADELGLDSAGQYVAGRIVDSLDGTRVRDMPSLPVEGFVGIVDASDADAADTTHVQTTGTLLDPDHDNWSQPDKPDDWMTSETQVRQYIQRIISQLVDNDILRIATVHDSREGQPVDVTLSTGMGD